MELRNDVLRLAPPWISSAAGKPDREVGPVIAVERRRGPTGGVLWTPAQIATALWLDAVDSTTIAAASGATNQWSDKSGNLRHATATGTSRPTTGTRTINSNNTLDFNGTTNSLAFAPGTHPLSGTTSGMVVFAFQLDSDPPTAGTAAGGVCMDWGSFAGSNHMPFIDGIIYEEWMTTTRYTAGNPTQSMSATVCVASMVSANNLWQLYINGSLQFTSASNTYGIGATPVIGGRTGAFMDGRIGEIVAVGDNISSTLRQQIEGYMAGPTRWAGQSLLPVGHPYKSAAPTI